MKYSVGSLVKVRGRDWVVLPSTDDSWYMLKPLGGMDAETICVSPDLEQMQPATFSLPDPEQAGDASSCALLRDAVRLGFRSTTGPFRSFGRIAVEPRPYQLVPLLMAMRQPVVRLLISDDVGIGKTIEASLIARELIDRGEIDRMAVICPPQLAEQWQKELEEKFHISAELVLPSTVARLERGLGLGTSLFEAYPYTIVSLDYIKSQRYRDEFVRACPEFVIIDEAHACASAQGNKASQQRYNLVRRLAENQNRHMLFVTATPHSGKEDVFRSLLSFLSPKFESLPEDLSGSQNVVARRMLAQHFVQRRRGDIRAYMDAATPFPTRERDECTWRFSPEEEEYFQEAVSLAQKSMQLGEGKDKFSQRVFWWSALALLRAVTSSPYAARSTLRNRSIGTDSEDRDVQRLDNEGRQLVLDLTYSDDASVTDVLAGADGSGVPVELEEGVRDGLRRRYRQLAKKAEKLEGAPNDSKLAKLIHIVKRLVVEGFSPVVFCRFIATAEYLREHLAKALPKDVSIEAVTGILAAEERENRVYGLAVAQKRVLVCTDCLSEGINLQNAFNAVVHYDLSWNPTRHEQREGRVDRFGQPFSKVKVVTLYGKDNPIDGHVLDVLLRKHENIRKALGVSVPYPEDGDSVIAAIAKSVLLRAGKRPSQAKNQQQLLPGMEDFLDQEKTRIGREWDRIAEREQRRSRTMFAQQAIKVDDVAKEIEASFQAAGSSEIVERFMSDAIVRLGGVDIPLSVPGSSRRAHKFTMDAQTLRQRRGLNFPKSLVATYALPVRPDQTLLTRTHPLVESLAGYVFSTAMDPQLPSVASRSGVMYTDAVQTRTTLLLCRFRFQLDTLRSDGTSPHSCLTEECTLLAFTGSPQQAVWVDEATANKLLSAVPSQNVNASIRTRFLTIVNEGMPELLGHLRDTMSQHADAFLSAHRRVRDATKERGVRYKVTPQGEPDVIGVFVYLPAM